MKDKILKNKSIIIDIVVTLLFIGGISIFVISRHQAVSNITKAYQDLGPNQNAQIQTNSNAEVLGDVIASPELLYEMLNGWNFVSFPTKPVSFSTASELINYIAKNGGYATTIARWDGDRWQEYSFRSGNEYGIDFDLIPLEAYFIRNHKKFTLRVVGDPIRENEIESISLKPGWNAIGMIGRQDTVKDKLKGINQENTEFASEIDWWNSGSWQVYVNRIYSEDSQKEYGQDSPIVSTRGYMIKTNQEVEIKP